MRKFIIVLASSALVLGVVVGGLTLRAGAQDLPDLHAPLPLLFLSRNGLFLGRRAHREKRQGDRRHQPGDQMPRRHLR